MAVQKSFTKTTTADYNHDRVADSTTVDTFIYKKGMLVEQRYETDWSGDSVFDFKSVTYNEYSKSGNLTKSVIQEDWEDNGTIDLQQTTKMTYDKADHLIKSLYQQDYGADGSVEWRSVAEHTYSQKGLLVQTVNRYDSNGSSPWDSADSIWYGYDGKELAWEQYDFQNDGTIDQTVIYDALVA